MGENEMNVAFKWALSGLEKDCATAQDAPNACGIHIHTGTTCSDASAVGGHFYDDSLASDPWATVVYTTESASGGTAHGKGVVDIGGGDIRGRAFVVHDATGGRVGCGLI